ncbi:hypothetical protein [Mycolicibacterium sp. 050158]|uniref:hypothetical protein n=1 Tax=Mycolicibacterium sp. 050158 TaxID=3090602 RepID=UPI00299ECCCE|nr:hypothetical protein [Mycolicibacterium sp. 050158]MDX1888957.1 hypothetical protein [Mycolicibacterium sp. 050158]
MTAHPRRGAKTHDWPPGGHLLAAIAVSVGLAATSAHGVAWADTPHADSDGSTSSSSSNHGGPDDHADADAPHQGAPATGTTSPKASESRSPKTQSAAGPTAEELEAATTAASLPSKSPVTQHDSSTSTSIATASSAVRTPPPPTIPTDTTAPVVSDQPDLTAAQRAPTTTARKAVRATPSPTSSQPEPTTTATTTATTATAATTTTVTPTAATVTATASGVAPAHQAAIATVAPTPATTNVAVTPSPPGPPSPIAQLIALPGKIINTLLQALDLTVAVGGPSSPFDFSPIDEALFAVFRRVEDVLGLDRRPVIQPVVPSLTYTGPTSAVTPTVSQFLDAAAAEYVLGGTPGGLQPFTVDGLPMTSTNILSGESAQVWVTPQQQVIIAYQGTTGGTNLLFNPLIAISQIITDAQVIFTDSTPQAFLDSLAFARQVQAAAAGQGYSAGDVFVTGHSLGGWEAEYVAQQTGLGGIGFESPGINTVVPANGADSGFVNVETYGDTAAYLATDLPALQPFLPAYVAGGGSKPHYGSIVMIGDPGAVVPLFNAASLWGTSILGDLIFAIDVLGNFFEHHLPGMQAHNLGIAPDPDAVPWLGSIMGPVEMGYGDLTIPQLRYAASAAGTLVRP